MAQRIDHLKDSLVERAAQMVRTRLDAQTRGAAERLLWAYYAHVPPEDILHREPEALYGAVMALFNTARNRKPGVPALRVYHPSSDQTGWDSPHSVVEMVNDDMPFLVDSVSAALEREDVRIHLLIHPVLAVDRDSAGKLVDIPEAPGARSKLESLIHIEIDRQSPEASATLQKKLAEVLIAVQQAVADWKPMRERAEAAIKELERTPAAEADSAEARDFLRWLHDDNFTFLGAVDVSFDAKGAASIEEKSRLGVMRGADTSLLDNEGGLAGLAPSALAFLRLPDPLLLAKTERAALVHRASPMDIVGAKRYGKDGSVVGIHFLVGLMGAAVYNQSPTTIPLLRRRVSKAVEHAGFRPASHDGRALQQVLEAYPRDELLQADPQHLFETAIGILRLQERRRTAIFLRRDEFDRFTTALVYIPRDRFDTTARKTAELVLEKALGGTVTAHQTLVGDSPLARLYFIIHTGPGSQPISDTSQVEAQLAEATRSWSDRLQEAMIEELGEERGLAQFRRWGLAFPGSYRETISPRMALADIRRIESSTDDGFALQFFRPAEARDNDAHFKIFRKGDPVPLSDVLPLFEHLGFRVIAEEPHALHPAGSDQPVWIHDFALTAADGQSLEVDTLRLRFEDAFRVIWQGEAESDGFNRLVVLAGLTWRQAMVLRAYSRYLRQTGAAFSPAYVERSIVANPTLAALLVKLFETRFNPIGAAEGTEIVAEIEQGLEAVTNADEDRILRRFLDMIDCTLRTNYFQLGKDGKSKPHLSFKIDSRRVQGLPLPRPMVEISVYSPRMEGIHLRGGKVARGGIRWSDRPEDFRTEILGLMKAQMVKNAVIVPVGSKGGFVLKRPTKTREEFLAEGVACYKILISGLLDITDNYAGVKVVPPERTVRRDADDPYLVVAADKGTATFSDVANAIAIDYGFWLGDAFASGGSVGYDHKVMGITARGAWESVKRHFREIGIDTQAKDFTTVGVGDMSGDVFGNGMLRSQHIRLVGAFDHRHIFLDPNPEPGPTFEERQRLFNLPRSSWADFDRTKLSRGGGIFPRDAKVIPITREVRARFGIDSESLTPVELIRRLLAADVDLLFFGGIGTYIKCSLEQNSEAGDRANDPVRIDGKELRAKVIGEGANLAMTQLGRIEAALNGRRLNTDAIDNSAGVSTSDHEVNIKILVDGAVHEGDLTSKRRNSLLAEMTDELGLLVLRDNYLQTQALTLMESQAPALLDQEGRFMHLLERANRLDRAVEFLPTDEEMTRRLHAGRGLVRPELSVMLAYGKMWLYDAILELDLPDDPLLFEDLVRYFPTNLRTPEWRERMKSHRLRREIIATAVTNSMVNRVGGSFIGQVVERTGTPPEDVARAYLVVRDAFELRDVWTQIEALDNKVAAATQTTMLIEINRLIERGVNWVLGHAERPVSVSRLHAELVPGIATVREHVDAFLPNETAQIVADRAKGYQDQGVPPELAKRVAQLIVLTSANDVSRIAKATGKPLEAVGRLYFLVAARFDFGWLRQAAEKQSGVGHWETLATDALLDDLYSRQAAITSSVAGKLGRGKPEAALDAWIEQRQSSVKRVDELLAELKATGKLELASLIVATHQLRGLAD